MAKVDGEQNSKVKFNADAEFGADAECVMFDNSRSFHSQASLSSAVGRS